MGIAHERSVTAKEEKAIGLSASEAISKTTG